MDSRRHSPGRRNYSFVFSIGWRRSRQQGSWPSWEKIETQQGTWTEPRLSNSCLFPLSGTVRYRCTVTVECGAPRILKTAQSPKYVTAKVAARATNVRCNNRLITSHSNSRPNIARDDIASGWQLEKHAKQRPADLAGLAIHTTKFSRPDRGRPYRNAADLRGACFRVGRRPHQCCTAIENYPHWHID